jgi:hypothetical protein
MILVMGLPRSSSSPNSISMLSALLLLTVIENLIRVDSFSIIKRNTPFCVPATMCRPLHASFLNDGDDSNINDGNSNASTNNDIEILKQIRERQLREAVLENLFLSKDLPASDSDSSSSSFLSLSLVGQSKLSLAARRIGYDEEKEKGKENKNNSFATVLVVSPTKGNMPFENNNSNSNEDNKNEPLPVLFLPLTAPTDSRLRLLSKVYAAKPISSFSNLIQWNLNLINRDDSLFDNIPWNQWSKDPDRKNRDQAGNLVLEKFRYGKRDAYNRFTGKDVNAKTVATSRRRYWEKKLISSLGQTNDNDNDSPDGGGASDDDPNDSDDGDNDNNNDSSFSQSFLSKRVLELRVQELRMEIAEVDSQLAISRTSNSKTQEDLEESRTELVQTLQEAERNLNDLLSSLTSSLSSPNSTVESNGINIIDKIARWAVDMSINVRTEQNEAPYRGATGYGPRLSYDDDDADVECYRSPFDLLNEILSDQLNAEVIECVLENTSWLGGTIALGGAVVLQRRTPTIETTLMGETLQTPDRDEDFGNFVKGGEIFVVECDVDEAIGIALSCDLPIRVERTIFERSSMMGVQVGTRENSENSNSENGKIIKSTYKNIKAKLPYWETLDSGISLDVEGDSSNPNASRLSPISIPRTTSSLFDTIFEPSPDNNGDDTSSSSMFPTDNPITSINQLDSLGNKGKAKTLLEMSNFSRRLPRPRTVRKAPANENPLDKLLLPLIDESVRNEYNIRDAERRGDLNLANELKEKRSKRQMAKEKVDAARRDGNEDLAEKWESEAEFLEALRADVTQDEGSYSRFLDKDDWYERDRQKTANRAKRSSFGNLLDGIE